jgi:hypothetical protein
LKKRKRNDVSRIHFQLEKSKLTRDWEERKYNTFDPNTFEYDIEVPIEVEENDRQDSSFGTADPPIVRIEDVPRETWISWPSESVDVPYFYKVSDECSISLYGPGEQRIAKVFGGVLQGNSVSYDVATPGIPPKKWEVKSLLNASEGIRPSTTLVTMAYGPARDELKSVFKGLVDLCVVLDDVPYEDDRLKLTMDSCRNFLEINQEAMTSKGEIGNTKFVRLQKILCMASTAKKIVESYGDVVNLGHLDSILSEPETFADRWLGSIDVNSAFGPVDGLIIVNPDRGFTVIPHERLKSVLKVERISQGKPKYVYTQFNEIPRIKFEALFPESVSRHPSE